MRSYLDYISILFFRDWTKWWNFIACQPRITSRKQFTYKDPSLKFMYTSQLPSSLASDFDNVWLTLNCHTNNPLLLKLRLNPEPHQRKHLRASQVHNCYLSQRAKMFNQKQNVSGIKNKITWKSCDSISMCVNVNLRIQFQFGFILFDIIWHWHQYKDFIRI